MRQRNAMGWLALLVVIVPAGAAEPNEPVSEKVLRDASGRALQRIQHSQAIAVRKENCASCHHQLVPELPLALARKRGVSYDEATARNLTRKTFGFLKDLDTFVQGHQYIDIQFDGWMLAAAHAAGIQPNLTTAAEAQFIAGRQLPDGSWRVMDGRPPQSYSRFTSAAVCARAVQKYLPESMREQKETCVRKAREWLLQAQPRTTEDRVFQLFGLAWTGADEGDRKKAAAALLAQQRADGGWAQLPTRESDSYATGSVLAALHLGAGLSTSDSAYQRGLRFLLKTQIADGSWRVATRMNPPAPVSPPFFTSGFPHGRDQFISIVGTSWAATAMMLALPADANAKPGDGYPDLAPAYKDPWISVAMSGTVAELKKLLDDGLKPNVQTAGGTTLLMLAAHDAAKVKLLIDRGADVNARAGTGFTALLVASRFAGNSEGVQLLLKAGAKPNPEKGVAVVNEASPVFFAATAGDLRTAAALLDAGAKPGQEMKMLGKIAATPLLYAVLIGDNAMADLLLRRGANPNEMDAEAKISVLSWAAIHNHADVVQLLLDRGAKVNHKDNLGMTPLLYAASIDYGDTVVIDKLIAAGADLSAQNDKGRTALDLAKEYMHPGLAAQLGKKATPR